MISIFLQTIVKKYTFNINYCILYVVVHFLLKYRISHQKTNQNPRQKFPKDTKFEPRLRTSEEKESFSDKR